MTATAAKPRILVVDDDADVLQLNSDLLRAAGAEIVAAANGEDAIREASKAVFNLCVLDAEMPKMNGFQVCRKLREMPHTASLPVLFLTSNSDSATVHNAFHAGASDFLSKPVVGRLLWHRITILLRIAELTRETQRLSVAVDCLKALP